MATNPEQYVNEAASVTTAPQPVLRFAPAPHPGSVPLDSTPPQVVVIGRTAGVYTQYVKPVLDRVLGALLLVLVSPLLAVVAAIIAIRLGRPILLAQERAGLGGQPFRMLKFRTMLPDRRKRQVPFVGPDRRVCHKSPNDPRHVPVGRFLRKWSLDELPQLINVVRGEMSLVGPRPELMHVVERYEPWQHLRHQVKPGLTGLWQVSQRGDGLMHEHTEIDLEYIRRVSFLTDLGILLKTIPATLGLHRGQ